MKKTIKKQGRGATPTYDPAIARTLALMLEGPSAELLSQKDIERLTPRRALRHILTFTGEVRELLGDDSSWAANRRALLKKTIKLLGRYRVAMQPEVEVYVPALDPTGHAFAIGDRQFPPGTHIVKSKTAQTLLEMMDKARIREEALYKPTNFTARLGEIGSHARDVSRVHVPRDSRGAGGVHVER